MHTYCIRTIGNQSRPKIFDLEIKKPDLLYTEVYEINERIILIKSEDDVTGHNYDPSKFVQSTSNELLYIEQNIDEQEIINILHNIQLKNIKTIAICLLHSYMYPSHEIQIKKIAVAHGGFELVTISSDLSPMIRMVPRGRCSVYRV